MLDLIINFLNNVNDYALFAIISNFTSPIFLFYVIILNFSVSEIEASITFKYDKAHNFVGLQKDSLAQERFASTQNLITESL